MNLYNKLGFDTTFSRVYTLAFSEIIFSALLTGYARFLVEGIEPKKQTSKFCTGLIQFFFFK